MEAVNLEKLREAVRGGRIVWRKHAFQKMVERGLTRGAVLDALEKGERVRDYVEDRPFPSVLVLGYTGNKPLHIVAAYDKSEDRGYIITVYEPSLDVFESDFKTRKK